MGSQEQQTVLIADINLRSGIVVLVLAFVIATTNMTVLSAQAQTFTVLHAFTGGGDRQYPWTGLTVDRAGQPLRNYAQRRRRSLQRRLWIRLRDGL